jgi:hypothetical protein
MLFVPIAIGIKKFTPANARIPLRNNNPFTWYFNRFFNHHKLKSLHFDMLNVKNLLKFNIHSYILYNFSCKLAIELNEFFF